MIDRESIRMALECATKINDDGKAATVISDAGEFIRWMQDQVDKMKEDSRVRLETIS